MRHEEASQHLAALVAGELGEPLRTTVEAHTADCAACRDWQQMYRAVSQVMTGAKDEADHPSSVELATWAVQPQGAPASGLAHLDSCARCRRELGLAREALVAARTATGTEAVAVVREDRHRRARLALAAACIAAVVAGGLLVRSTNPPSDTFHLSNETLAGHRLITAESSIRADAVEIAQGSEITFEAGDVISMGNGFTVADGAVFAATTSSTE